MSGSGGLSSLDYWRLADELSVPDAAILITGNDPSEKIDMPDDDGFFTIKVQRRDYEGYEAVFKALRNAILTDKLKATVGFRARDTADVGGHVTNSGEPVYVRREMDADLYEVAVPFDTLLKASGFRMSIFTNRSLSLLQNATKLYVLKEPDWDETMIGVDDLKAWLSNKGIAPPFFFPQGRTEGFRDKEHPRYSPKLACAVAAWEAVKKPKPNSSAKATLEDWVRANAVRFNMIGSDGIPTSKAIAEVCAVANWATSGGAVPTYVGGQDEVEEVPAIVKNFETAHDGDLPEIPF